MIPVHILQKGAQIRAGARKLVSFFNPVYPIAAAEGSFRSQKRGNTAIFHVVRNGINLA